MISTASAKAMFTVDGGEPFSAGSVSKMASAEITGAVVQPKIATNNVNANRANTNVRVNPAISNQGSNQPSFSNQVGSDIVAIRDSCAPL